MGEIRFVGTGETRGYPYLVYKKKLSFTGSTFLKHNVLHSRNGKLYTDKLKRYHLID